MEYKTTSLMDCGYFAGSPEGLLHFPPPNSPDRKPDGKPVVIPWNVFDEADRMKNQENDKK